MGTGSRFIDALSLFIRYYSQYHIYLALSFRVYTRIQSGIQYTVCDTHAIGLTDSEECEVCRDTPHMYTFTVHLLLTRAWGEN